MSKFVNSKDAPDHFIEEVQKLSEELIGIHQYYLSKVDPNLYMNALSYSFSHMMAHILDDENALENILQQIKRNTKSIEEEINDTA